MAKRTFAAEAPGDSSGVPAIRRGAKDPYPTSLKDRDGSTRSFKEHNSGLFHTSRRRLQYPTIIAAVLVLAALAWPSRPILEIRGRDEAILYQRPVRVGERIVLRYTHSVARRPVEETFVVLEGDCLVLREATYDSFGAGLPTEPQAGEKLVLDGSVMRITGMNRVFTELSLAVGGIARHELRFLDGRLALLDLVPAGSSVRIRVTRRPIWRALSTRSAPKR